MTNLDADLVISKIDGSNHKVVTPSFFKSLSLVEQDESTMVFVVHPPGTRVKVPSADVYKSLLFPLNKNWSNYQIFYFVVCFGLVHFLSFLESTVSLHDW